MVECGEGQHLNVCESSLASWGRVQGWTIRRVGTVSFGVLEIRCGAMRCDLEGAVKIIAAVSRHPRKRVLQISSLQELVCLVPPLAGPNARFVPVLLSSPLLPSPPLSSPLLPSPPPSAALPLAHGWHAVAGHRCLIRKQNCWVSATRASTTNASIVQPLPIICASAREASIRTEFHTRTIASPLQFRMPWRS
jgi:hypothetical protein